VIQT